MISEKEKNDFLKRTIAWRLMNRPRKSNADIRKKPSGLQS